MTFPLYFKDAFGYEIALFLYALVGVGFGFVLERAGFGYAPNLAAQFYGTDTRVLKVMFTAIVTACVGVVLLSTAGVLDLSAVTIPQTYLWPQLVGGFLLGIGFIMSGYCPGTAVVAATSGKWDGLLTVVGVGLGSLLYGLFYPWIEGFANSGDLGVIRLSDLLGISDAILAVAVVAMAFGAFLVAERAERFFGQRRGLEVKSSGPRARNTALGALGGAGVIAVVVSMLAGGAQGVGEVVSGEGAKAVQGVKTISPEALATALIERPWSLWLLDLRDPKECEQDRIPGALCSIDNIETTLSALAPTRTLVLYGQGDLKEPPLGARAFKGSIALLEGGYKAFVERFRSPPDASLAQSDPAAFRFRSAVHSWLTGAATSAPPPPSPSRPSPGGRPKKKGGGC